MQHMQITLLALFIVQAQLHAAQKYMNFAKTLTSKLHNNIKNYSSHATFQKTTQFIFVPWKTLTTNPLNSAKNVIFEGQDQKLLDFNLGSAIDYAFNKYTNQDYYPFEHYCIIYASRQEEGFNLLHGIQELLAVKFSTFNKEEKILLFKKLLFLTICDDIGWTSFSKQTFMEKTLNFLSLHKIISLRDNLMSKLIATEEINLDLDTFKLILKHPNKGFYWDKDLYVSEEVTHIQLVQEFLKHSKTDLTGLNEYDFEYMHRQVKEIVYKKFIEQGGTLT